MEMMIEKKRLVPELRFREFENEWKSLKLIKLSKNGFSNGAFNDPRKVGSGYRIINVKDMYTDGTISVDNLERVALDEKEFSKNRVEFGDIFFTRSSLVKEGIAFSNVNLTNEDDLTYDGHLIRMQPNKEICSPLFLYYTFKTRNSRKQFIVRGKTATMTTIGQEDISDVNVPIPQFPEQQKIATFLTAIDRKLQQLNTKKTLLEQYKTGVMQQLFSQTLRFKEDDGKDYGDWKFLHGNMLFESVSDKNHNSDLPILAISQEFGAIPREMINYNISVEDKSVDGYKVIQKGDFIISLRSFQGGIEYSNYKGICSPAYNILRPKPSLVVDGFYRYYLKTEFYIRQLQQKLEGIRDGKMISFKYFSEIKLPNPSLAEQQKIASYLSAIDKKIEIVDQQIEKTQAFKKGLLQGMFV